ncbi:Protein of unknown function (DUF3152) [Promicromonospora thailandica]|uniref:DUF3152 domain-containing protein n=1 Tax=Promicromonospora thailandica TaxID=765201 RepID=A0A9X2JWC1_9MICO|nr:Protein of unknown function (DUF3152) [Promicromonospora thailandica]
MVGVSGPASPRRAILTLGLCLALGLGAGVVVTMATEPDASASAVAGVVEDNLGAGAADVVRDAYEAARSGDRTSPPDPVATPEPGGGAAVDAAAAGADPGAGAPSSGPETAPPAAGEPATAKSAPPSPAPVPSPSRSTGPEPDPGSGLTGTRTVVEEKLSGTLLVARGSRAAPAEGKVWRVQIAVEKGLPVDRQVFAEAVLATLNDPRGWNAADGSTFAWTDTEDYDARVVLASPGTTDQLCLPLDTISELSCGIEGTAVLNFRRWATGSRAWDDIDRYRQYLVNHEVGHVIGHRHDLCAGEGEHATVMVQQTTTTSGCIPEPWPAPHAG